MFILIFQEVGKGYVGSVHLTANHITNAAKMVIEGICNVFIRCYCAVGFINKFCYVTRCPFLIWIQHWSQNGPHSENSICFLI